MFVKLLSSQWWRCVAVYVPSKCFGQLQLLEWMRSTPSRHVLHLRGLQEPPQVTSDLSQPAVRLESNPTAMCCSTAARGGLLCAAAANFDLAPTSIAGLRWQACLIGQLGCVTTLMVPVRCFTCVCFGVCMCPSSPRRLPRWPSVFPGFADVNNKTISLTVLEVTP